jgi:hypothetical protein
MLILQCVVYIYSYFVTNDHVMKNNVYIVHIVEFFYHPEEENILCTDLQFSEYIHCFV